MNKYLLNTHAIIWYLNGSPKLSDEMVSILENVENHLYVSIVSFWEIAIKLKLKKLSLPVSFEDFIALTEQHQITVLPIASQALQKIIQLDLHHRDPFDRMIIAQAETNNMIVCSADVAFDSYPGIQRIW